MCVANKEHHPHTPGFVDPLGAQSSMNFDGPRESGSMSMDIDDGAAPCRHHHRCESVKMNSCDSSSGQTPFDSQPQNHQLTGSFQRSIHSLPNIPLPECERLPGSDGSPQLTVLAPSSSLMNHLAETQNHPGPASQHRAILSGLKSSVQEVTPRKRKHSHDSLHTHITNHDDISHDDDTHSQPRRRVRPRLRTQQDREFTPLLIMSPGRERDFSVEEETISAFYYPPTADVTDPPYSIQRYFYPGNSLEDGQRILQSSSLPTADDMEDPKERGRSNSASSFAEVALAHTATRKVGRLSTLQDFHLPRPFEETGPSLGSIKVHERGLEALPSFLSTSGGRVTECGTRAVSPRSTLHPLEPSMGNFFDKPMCESPESIDPDEGGLAHLERLTTQVAHCACHDSTPGTQPGCRTTDNSAG